MEGDSATFPELTTALVGRERELALFSSLLERIHTQGRYLFLISGPPGIGKSRLLEELCTVATGGEASAGKQNAPAVSRFRFREGIALSGETVWSRIIRGFSSTGLEAGKDLTGSQPGIIDAFLRVCGDTPLVLFLDDLHLAGEQFLIVLDDLLEEMRESSLLVVAAYQDLPAYRERFISFLSDVKHIPRVLEHRLSNLSVRESSRLIEAVIGAPPARPILDKVMKQTGGNPLFVHEISRLIAHNRRPYEENPDALWEKEIPRVIHTAIGRRLAKLSQRCTEDLRLLSLLGEGFSDSEIARIWPERVASQRRKCLQEAIDYGFIRVGGKRRQYYFSHSIIRSAIAASIPETELEETCCLLVERMERGGFGATNKWALKLADLWSAISGDEAVRNYRHYIRAAAEAAFEDGEYELAGKLLEKILPLSRDVAVSQDEAALYSRLAEAKSISGYRAEASELYSKAFRFYKQQHDIDGMVAIASRSEYVRTGEPGYIDFYNDILKALPESSERRGWVLLNHAISLTTSVGDYKKAELVLKELDTVTEGTEDVRLRLMKIVVRAGLDLMCMRYEESLRRIRHAENTMGIEDPFVAVHILGTKLFILPVSGRLGEAMREIPSYIDGTLKLNDRYFLSFSFYHTGRLKARQGRWKEAMGYFETGMSYYPYLSELLAWRANIEYMLGNTSGGDRYRRRLLYLQRRTPPGPYKPHIYASYTSAVRGLCTGEAADTARWIPTLRRIADEKDVHPFITIRAHLCLLLSGIVLKDRDLIKEQTAVLESPRKYYLISPVKIAWAIGLGALTLGRREAAAECLEKALQYARFYQDAPMEACILYDLGRACLLQHEEQSKTAKAKQTLHEAHKRAEGLGMMPLCERVHAFLGEFSGRGVASSYALTDREREVVELVEQGMSNKYIADRLYISVHTVANHIRHILEKTGTANRSAAAAAVRRMNQPK
jgi:DNA-binding CsgD family transcriptional regulator